MRILCLTNLFCWMSLVCYSLYFTDFVGEAVFGGNPKVWCNDFRKWRSIHSIGRLFLLLFSRFQAPVGSFERETYEEGVRFACWGMAMYSLSCSCYSFIIERLVKRFKYLRHCRALLNLIYLFFSFLLLRCLGLDKFTWVANSSTLSVWSLVVNQNFDWWNGSDLEYHFLFLPAIGMILMALTRSPAGVIIFSWTAGVMYSTLFTMPYLLVANYHASQVVCDVNHVV